MGGRLSDRTGRRKLFVAAAAVVYGVGLFLIAVAGDFDGFLVGMAVGGVGFGVYMAVDLALVADVLPDTDTAAKDLGVLNIAGALPFSHRPGDGTGGPGDRRWQLPGAVRRRRGLRARGRRRHPPGEAGPVTASAAT